MPGILPMKVIKIGSNAQSRIAQACDRCRSKKIRCDGIRPSCSQCINVGFECKTSDKLSRRAFPRGYTESLEERVRSLEAEVRELKDLLDEKDEKIDLLSRIHTTYSPQSISPPRLPSAQSPIPTTENREQSREKDDVFKVQQSPVLLEDENCNSYFVGLSSGRTVVDAFKLKVQESSRPCTEVNSDTFFHPTSSATMQRRQNSKHAVSWKAPPRMTSDQMINIFFQEWAPLFPVLHRPTFLTLYEQYVADPEAMTDRKSLAMLNLVFGIAALSSNSTRNIPEIASFEAQWQSAIGSVLMENSLPALQCLSLAQVYCILSADYTRLLKYKGLAISLSHRLGLHQSQKRFALGTLTVETRKKMFWTLYTLDCLSAAHLGLPRMLNEEDIHCEYPIDADDEYLTEGGILPCLPGESTKVSGALALFRACRILGKVLHESYPTSPSHEISFRNISSQAEELDSWYNNLPAHLRLHFAQDKPSTNVTGSRSPILALVYHYIRSLIYRPAVCANIGAKSSSAIMAFAHSAKSIIQIIQLLDERSLSCSLPVNRNELVVLSGFGLLFQTLPAEYEGKLMKDCQKMIFVVIDLLDKSNAPFSTPFRRIAHSVLLASRHEMKISPPLSRHNSGGSMGAPQESALSATQRHLKALASRFPSISKSEREVRRATVPHINQHPNQSSTSLDSNRSEPIITRSELALSPNNLPGTKSNRSSTITQRTQNLDFLSFDKTPIAANYMAQAQSRPKQEVSPSDWERLLGSLDNGTTNIYDNIYGGPPVDALLDVPITEPTWSSDIWNTGLGNFPLEHIHQANPTGPQSVLSFSDESLTSGEEYGADLRSVNSSNTGERNYANMLMPELDPTGIGLDTNYGL